MESETQQTTSSGERETPDHPPQNQPEENDTQKESLGHWTVKDREIWTPLVRRDLDGTIMGMVKCYGKFHPIECEFPTDLTKIRKVLWKESLQMLAEHTLFDHSGKEPVVEYQTAVDNWGNKLRQKEPPKSNTKYRSTTKASSSESEDAKSSKTIRQSLDSHETPFFPLTPDFTDARKEEVEGYALNLSLPKQLSVDSSKDCIMVEDMQGLDLSTNSSADNTNPEEKITKPETPAAVANAPEVTKVIREDPVWKIPRTAPQKSSTESVSSDNSDLDLYKITPRKTLVPRHKLDREKMAKLKETIRGELAKIRLECERKEMEKEGEPTPSKRKREIEPITWDPSDNEYSIDLRENIKRRRRSRESDSGSPSKENNQTGESAATQYTDEVEQNDDLKLEWYCRKCHLCMRPAKNMKKHLAFAHLGKTWWGVLGDQTCWRCNDYHTLGKISTCDGFYLPMANRGTLHVRHKEFMDFLMEDFEAVSPQHLVQMIRDMKLCNKSTSSFSDREEFILKEIDTMYGLPHKETHTASDPTRPSDLLHWRTVVEILAYLKDRGAVTSDTRATQSTGLVDTRCDLTQEYG